MPAPSLPHESDPLPGQTDACHACWRDDHLALGNALFTEVWRAEQGGRLRLVSFRRNGGPEWVSPRTPARPGPNDDPLSAPEADGAEMRRWTASFSLRAPGVTETNGGALEATLTFEDPISRRGRRHRFELHPGVAGAVHRLEGGEIDEALGACADNVSGTAPTPLAGGMRVKPNGQMFVTLPETAHPLFELAERHLRVREVQLVDQTDHHSNLAFERDWLTHPGERCLTLRSNLVCIERLDTPSDEGFLWLLMAPLPHVRARWSAFYDFLFAFQAGRLVASACPLGYALARLAYSGGRAGATRALHELQRACYRALPPQPATLLSNTWGDRAGAAHLSESFVLEEIEAARALGVEVVQIDDGWQRGATVNTASSGGVWNGFWAADPDFWTPHPQRFPRGLAPLVAAAEAAGVQLGLWYAPDSTDALVNWERDAAQLLALWREHRIHHFKLDAVKLHSRLAETRFHALCDRVLAASGGSVCFDFDATAENRPTFFGRPGGGPVFLENRFTEQAGYYPHQTLRALWSLAHYVRPERLRVEFLNPARNEADYEGDPLRPAAYGPEYLFAVALPAAPLAWFEVCRVPEAIARRWRPLIALWKAHREAFADGEVFPVGNIPDGHAWTGFVSLARKPTPTPGTVVLYALIFRETNREAERLIELPRVPPLAEGTVGEALAGAGDALLVSGGVLRVRIPGQRQFFFAAWRQPGRPAFAANLM